MHAAAGPGAACGTLTLTRILTTTLALTLTLTLTLTPTLTLTLTPDQVLPAGGEWSAAELAQLLQPEPEP